MCSSSSPHQPLSGPDAYSAMSRSSWAGGGLSIAACGLAYAQSRKLIIQVDIHTLAVVAISSVLAALVPVILAVPVTVTIVGTITRQ